MTDYTDKWRTVKVEVDEGVAWVTLNRPDKRNSMSPELNQEMALALDAVELDYDADVLVLTGARRLGSDLRRPAGGQLVGGFCCRCVRAAGRPAGHGLSVLRRRHLFGVRARHIHVRRCAVPDGHRRRQHLGDGDLSADGDGRHDDGDGHTLRV